MGCFPACFGLLKHKKTMKDVQDQCTSPINDSVKLLPTSLKEDDILEPTKMEEVEKEMSFAQEESSESLFSLSIDSRRRVYGADVGDKEVNSPLMKQSSKHDEDKENVALRKVLEAQQPEDELKKADVGDKEVNSPLMKQSLKHDEDTENVALRKVLEAQQPEDELKKRESEVRVETSLSSWLVASGKLNKMESSSPQSENNYGEREALGEICSEFKEVNGILSGCSTDDPLESAVLGDCIGERSEVVVEVC